MKDKNYSEMLFLQTLMIFEEKLKEKLPEIYEYCIGFVKVLKNEIEVDPQFIIELNDPDNVNEASLSDEFIRWTLDFDKNFTIQEDPTNHAKYIFRELLQNPRSIDKFFTIFKDPQILNFIAHLCKVKIFKYHNGFDNNILNLVLKLFQLKLFTNFTFGRITVEAMKHFTQHVSGSYMTSNPEYDNFCYKAVPLVENIEDPYFKISKKMIMYILNKRDNSER
jgi:hypothetical protein